MPTAERSFVGEAASIGDARRFLRRTLMEWGTEALEGPATAVLSELATNSVLHAHSGFTVVLLLDGNLLRLNISDSSVQAPRRRPHGADSSTGRGLMLVSALSRAWGVDTRNDGKTVWAELGASAGQGRYDEVASGSVLDSFPALGGAKAEHRGEGSDPQALTRAA